MVNKAADWGWLGRSQTSTTWFCFSLLVTSPGHPHCPVPFLLASITFKALWQFTISGLDLTELTVAFCLSSFPFYMWPLHASTFVVVVVVCGILVPWPGIKPAPPTLEAWSPNHLTDWVFCPNSFSLPFLSLPFSIVIMPPCTGHSDLEIWIFAFWSCVWWDLIPYFSWEQEVSTSSNYILWFYSV